MREFIVDKNNNNKKVSHCIKNKYPNIKTSKIFIALRNKDIRINDIKINSDVEVYENDKVTVYLKDAIIFNVKESLDVIYEDDNILVINKPAEMLSEKNVRSDNEPNAEDILKHQTKLESIKLCHRLDRNTSGLLIFSKTEVAHNEMICGFKNGYISKKYIAYVDGTLKVKSSILKSYLFKDSNSSKVTISQVYKKGYEEIITEYKVISESNNYSILEITLHTGKTHQIRAHLASIGHPIICDGKYGDYDTNKKYKTIFKTQALFAYKYNFKFPKDFLLNYLNNVTIALNNVVFKI